MDSLSCLAKLSTLRVKELKEVLTKMELPKSGRKEILVDRIARKISHDQATEWYKKEAERLIHEAYRNMKDSVASTSRNRGNNGIVESSHVNKIDCLCRSWTATDRMITCHDQSCQNLQHTDCVIVPEREGVYPSPPEVFYCQLCRLSRADPFWMSIAHPIHPLRLSSSKLPVPAATNSSDPVQGVLRPFNLRTADRDLLLQQDHDIQAWCMLLDDKVSFRMQWPKNVELEVNGVPVRAVNEGCVSKPLGPSGRHDGCIITHYVREGINTIYVLAYDARVFCFGIRIVKRRSIHQILDLIPKESEGEKLEDAVARVRRCVGGGASADSELEVVDGWTTVSLRCPLSSSRMKVAARFKSCHHLGCFDLHVFLEMNKKTRKWQCPQCLENYSLDKIVIDPYFNRIAAKMSCCEEDITDIEIKHDGSWRVKVEGGDLALWHYPDGTPHSSEKQLGPDSQIIVIDSDMEDEDRIGSHHDGIGTGVTASPPPAQGMP